jgi:hypothetical protein
MNAYQMTPSPRRLAVLKNTRTAVLSTPRLSRRHSRYSAWSNLAMSEPIEVLWLPMGRRS